VGVGVDAVAVALGDVEVAEAFSVEVFVVAGAALTFFFFFLAFFANATRKDVALIPHSASVLSSDKTFPSQISFNVVSAL